jgi:rhomboid-like protein
MTAFVIVTCLICYGIGHYYEPPDPEYRLWPHLSPTTATICAVIATNVFICSMWRFAPAWQFMTKYFMHVPGYPRAVQSVTNIFSHVQYEHLISNMMFFALVGTVCHDLVGRGIFLGTYVAAGAVGTLASLYWANIGRGSFSAHSVGASAAIWGIATLYCLLTDTETVKVPFVKDMEVGFYPKLLLAAFIAQEIRVATRKKQSTMDHASHFGGMLVGMATAGYLRATGFHERRKKVAGTDGVQERAMGGESKTLDVGKLVKEEVGQVKEGVRKIVKE